MDAFVSYGNKDMDEEIYEYIPERRISEDSNNTDVSQACNEISLDFNLIRQTFSKHNVISNSNTNFDVFSGGSYNGYKSDEIFSNKSSYERLFIIQNELKKIDNEINHEENDQNINLEEVLSLNKRIMDKLNKPIQVENLKLSDSLIQCSNNDNSDFSKKIYELLKRSEKLENIILGTHNIKDLQHVPIYANVKLLNEQCQFLNEANIETLENKLQNFSKTSKSIIKIDAHIFEQTAIINKINFMYQEIVKISHLIEQLPRLTSSMKYIFNTNSQAFKLSDSLNEIIGNQSLLLEIIKNQENTLEAIKINIKENMDIVNENINLIKEKSYD